MKSVVAKRSIVIDKHKTSVSLEDQFWSGLKSIASEKQLTLSELISGIDHERQHGNLSSALRLYVLGWYRGLEPAAAQGLAAPNTHRASQPKAA